MPPAPILNINGKHFCKHVVFHVMHSLLMTWFTIVLEKTQVLDVASATPASVALE